MMVNVRYGVEVEGAFKGLKTLILPSSQYHFSSVVDKIMGEHPECIYPMHLWLELQPGERFNWDDVRALVLLFKVTLQVRYPVDTPPISLLEQFGIRLSVVWMVPDEFASLAASSEYIKHATAPGKGWEAEVVHTPFDPADYAKDEEWPF